MKQTNMKAVLGASVALAAAIGIAAASGCGDRNVSSKNSVSSVSTNENGAVSRLFTESTVTTNGNMVTEHRRETRTTTDTDGNMLETTTSEYAQSYPVGENGIVMPQKGTGAAANAKADNTSFMGLNFGETLKGTNFVADASEPTLLRTEFKPKKALSGFDDYYVYVTPKTHRVAKIYACAKEAIEPGSVWKRHYLVEALEKRYGTWARLASWCRPCYAFDIGGGRYVTACLTDSSRDYETVVAAWDDALLTAAADETEELREERIRNAEKKRNARVTAAADAF